MKTTISGERNLIASRQTIITHYLGPSNVRGARIAVRGRTHARPVMIVSYEHGMSMEKNHRAAREAFCAQHQGQGWTDHLTWVQANINDVECVHIALDDYEVDHLFMESAESQHLVPSLLRRQAE